MILYEVKLGGGKAPAARLSTFICLSPSSGSAVKPQDSKPYKQFEQLLKKALHSSSNSHAKRSLKKK